MWSLFIVSRDISPIFSWFFHRKSQWYNKKKNWPNPKYKHWPLDSLDSEVSSLVEAEGPEGDTSGSTSRASLGFGKCRPSFIQNFAVWSNFGTAWQSSTHFLQINTSHQLLKLSKWYSLVGDSPTQNYKKWWPIWQLSFQLTTWKKPEKTPHFNGSTSANRSWALHRQQEPWQCLVEPLKLAKGTKKTWTHLFNVEMVLINHPVLKYAKISERNNKPPWIKCSDFCLGFCKVFFSF